MIKDLDQIVLTTDLPEYGLKSSDNGTIVLSHQGGAGYEVEFVALDGETLAVISLFAAQVRPIVYSGECEHRFRRKMSSDSGGS